MNKEDSLYKLRHSLAHVLAQAVEELYPNVKLCFGPPVENGFYYDFDFGDTKISNSDLKNIEKKMRKIIVQNQSFSRRNMNSEEALNFLKELQSGRQTYKIEHINNLISKGITEFSFYENGPFVDLCRGPHVENTKELPIKSFSLDRISGAYWLSDANKPQLTRIYAVCFSTEQEKLDYLKRRERASKLSHHILGKELKLFYFNDMVGKGLVLWLANGTIIRDCIEQYAKEMEFKYGYDRVTTPHIAKEELYLKSQHIPAYKDSMYPCIHDPQEDVNWYLKPMNCPHHHLIFSSQMRSYKELPLRIAEYGTCYRYEQSGELSGLLRVRAFSMNDGHIYLRKEQLKSEFDSLIKMYLEFYNTFGFKDYKFRISIRSDEEKKSNKFKGDSKLWDDAEKFLIDIMKEAKISYYIGEGEAAFYGPKIDIQFKNLMGREETLSTIQIDYLSAKNFNLNFINENNQEEEVVIIHRAPLSTHERFISFLIEYYAGAFPTWCAPQQVIILPISEHTCLEYARQLEQEMKKDMIRVTVDVSDNSFNKKIRIHSKNKVPVVLIIGEREVNEDSVTVRRYKQEEQITISREEFLSIIKEEIKNRTLNRQLEDSII